MTMNALKNPPDTQPYEVKTQGKAAVLRRPDTLRGFLAAADARLAAAPQDATALWARAQMLRGLGELAAAADAYDAYAAVQPEDLRPRALARLMRGDPNGVVLSDGPVPFLRVDDFLSPADLAGLWERMAAHKRRFEPSQVWSQGGGRVNPATRVSLTANADRDLRIFLLPRVEAAMAALGLPRRFGLPDLTGGEIEMQETSHIDGCFLRIHCDNRFEAPKRTLTYVCYFKRPAASFTGGDLLLLDEDRAGFTRVIPSNNALLFFPSSRLHEVTPVACDATDPLDGRVTVHGWFHRH